MSSPRVVPLEQASEPHRFGSKTAMLAALSREADLLVPPGVALGAELFRSWIEGSLPAPQWPERLLAGPAAERRPERLARIHEALLREPLPAPWREELARALPSLGEGPFAVRSSALHEDTAEGSAAGLQETVLGVLAGEPLELAVRRCLASLYRERALTYLARRPLRVAPSVAVLIQRLVCAESAGVLFSRDPLDPSAPQLRVEAAWGLGSSVVDGAAAPAVYELRRDGEGVRTTPGRQRRALRWREGALQWEPVPGDPERVDPLGAGQLERLRALGVRLEREAGGVGQDLEWAVEGERLWVLQRRPIVRPKEGERERWLWSNVNVGEALPGVATPLTWSLASQFSDTGFRKAFAGLGCEVPAHAELVGNFQGRIYLNLTHFMEIAGQVPLLDPGMLLEFGGGGGHAVVEQQAPRPRWGRFLLRAPLTAARMLWENASLDGRLERFERAFLEHRRDYHPDTLASLGLLALRERLAALEALLDETGALMLTCASGSLSAIVAVRGVLRVLLPRDARRLEHELLSGTADLESALPGIALAHLAATARREPAALAALRAREPAALRLQDLPEGSATRRGLERFLEAYGARAAREAELATPRWSEAPGPVFAVLCAQLERGAGGALEGLERQLERRAAAEREVLGTLAPIARAALRHLLARTRRFVRLRERMRARVTEVLGFFRNLALASAARLAEREAGLPRDAVFFLTVREWGETLAGHLGAVGALCAARRADYLRDCSRPDPPSHFVGRPPPVAPAPPEGASALCGVAAAPGVVEGPVRVLRDPADAAELRPGEILVTAVADVGWTPLFLVSAAVVTELGGALSHAALVAREYGVPAVFNVAHATRVLRTGQRVRVDGTQGVLHVLRGEAPRG